MKSNLNSHPIDLHFVSILIYLEVKNEAYQNQFPQYRIDVSILIYLEVKNEGNLLQYHRNYFFCFNPNLSGSKKWREWYQLPFNQYRTVSILIYLEVKNEVISWTTDYFFIWSFNPNLSGSKKWSDGDVVFFSHGCWFQS